jgi:hypothetical protein
MDDGEFCNASQRVDGKLHSWEFDGDDPRVRCCWCGEIRDALTGKPIKTSPSSAEPDPWELLRELYEAREAMGTSSTMTCSDETFSRLCKASSAVNVAIKQHDAERKSDGT